MSEGNDPAVRKATPEERSLFGTGTLAEGGYGLHQGVPYGDALVDEAATFEREHRFTPGSEKLRAATKRALGRGL